jgi:iron donor protein CyaY
MAVLSEQEFRVKSDEALENARRTLLPLADDEGFEIDLQNGVLNLVFEEPSDAKFVVSPNAPVRQIWVSAMARSYKLAWAPELGAFALDGETLPRLLERLTRTFLEGS